MNLWIVISLFCTAAMARAPPRKVKWNVPGLFEWSTGEQLNSLFPLRPESKAPLGIASLAVPHVKVTGINR